MLFPDTEDNYNLASSTAPLRYMRYTNGNQIYKNERNSNRHNKMWDVLWWKATYTWH